MTDQETLAQLRTELDAMKRREEAFRRFEAWVREKIYGQRVKSTLAGTWAAMVVDLTTDGGADGSVAAPPTYTYQVDLKDETNILNGASPECARPNGSFVDASTGLAYQDVNGDWHLWLAWEIPNTGECEA